MCNIRWKVFGCGPPSQDASDHQDYEIFSGDPLRTKPSSITRILGGGHTHDILQLQIDKNHFMAVEESGNRNLCILISWMQRAVSK